MKLQAIAKIEINSREITSLKYDKTTHLKKYMFYNN